MTIYFPQNRIPNLVFLLFFGSEIRTINPRTIPIDTGDFPLTSTETSVTPVSPTSATPWYKSKKMWIAVPLTLALSGMSLAIYQPAAAIAGMLTDSCSSTSNAGQVWEIWLWYLWPAVMVACAFIPSYILLKNKSWWKVVLGVIAFGAVSLAWYILWAPILWITGC